MSCTPEEIEEKRKIALERLKARQSENTANSTSTLFSKTPNSFYGQLKNLNGIVPNSSNISLKLSNKIKENPLKKQRIWSQPYPSTAISFSGASKNANTSTLTAPLVLQKLTTCSCSMITEDRFQVVPSGFHAKLIDVFKTIPSRSYDVNTKIWSFHLDEYDIVQERVGILKPDVTIGSIPKFVFRILSQPKLNLNESCLSSLEPTIMDSLMNFQKRGVCFGIEKRGRCMIADEMGLGKTYQALALADFYRDDWPLLICTTAATRDVWVSKVQSLLPYVPLHHIVCMTSVQDYFGDAKVLIMSYNIMEKNEEKLEKKNFGFAIFDESHFLKNFKAKSTNVALKLASKVKRIVLLTGTPALSRPSELFTQLQMIDSKTFSYHDYIIRYCEGHLTNFGWNANGQANLQELRVILNRKFMIRRTKQEVQMELADKSRETVILDRNLLHMDLDTVENMKSFAEDFTKLKGKEKEDVLMRYYSETAKAKTKAVTSYIKGLIKEKKKFIIFAHHQVMLNALSDCFDESNVNYIRIDGSTRNDLRTAYIERFQTKSKCRVALLSLKACNTGITLTAAQLVIFAELDWNPSTLAQAESRAHRIGQEGNVICRYLLAPGTADDAIWVMLQNKQNVLNKAGLFHEDLADGTSTAMASSIQVPDIKKYLTNTQNESTSKNDESNDNNKLNENKKLNEQISESTKPNLETKNSTQNILDDDNDELFMDLDF